MKPLLILFLLVLILTAQTYNAYWVATWIWVDFPGQNPPGKWVLVDLQPNTGL